MKRLRELTTFLQTLCHNGDSDKSVMIKVLDGYYHVGKVLLQYSGDKPCIILEAESV